jgi:hypothetical protein
LNLNAGVDPTGWINPDVASVRGAPPTIMGGARHPILGLVGNAFLLGAGADVWGAGTFVRPGWVYGGTGPCPVLPLPALRHRIAARFARLTMWKDLLLPGQTVLGRSGQAYFRIWRLRAERGDISFLGYWIFWG